MPNYRADLDIAAILDGGLTVPGNLDPAEAGRIHKFLRCDQTLEQHYRTTPGRPPEAALRAAAQAVIDVYDQRSSDLPLGWQKFAVLQAGIAASEDNLDSFEIQDWAYTHVKANDGWLGDFDDDLDREKPLRWLAQLIGVGVLMGRQRMAAPAPPSRKKGWLGRS